MMRSRRSSAALLTRSLKSERIWRVVSTPTIAAKPSRITIVSAADPPARRQRSGRRLYAENVARAADRVKEARLPTGFQLLSQVGDEHLDRVGDREGVVAPHLVQQLLARDDDALVAHQVLQQLELALGERDRALAATHLVAVGIEHQVADDQLRAAPGWPAAQQGTHPRQELAALERLDQVVVGAGVQALHARL